MPVMLQIECPWCGPRDEREFRYGGEVPVVRPAEPEATGDEVWAHYLYYRTNRQGRQRERWLHRYGCHQWLVVERDTVTHAISAIGPLVPQPAEEP